MSPRLGNLTSAGMRRLEDSQKHTTVSPAEKSRDTASLHLRAALLFPGTAAISVSSGRSLNIYHRGVEGTLTEWG